MISQMGKETAITHIEITNNLRMAGEVNRYHTWPMMEKQPISNHTWHVMRLYVTLFGIPRPQVWYFMLIHDIVEIKTGDMPSYVKLNFPGFRELFDKAEKIGLSDMNLSLPNLKEWEFTQFKICDMLERIEFAYFEMLKGNRLAEPIFETFERDVARLNLTSSLVDKVTSYIINMKTNLSSSNRLITEADYANGG